MSSLYPQTTLYGYSIPIEFKVVPLRECAIPLDLGPCDQAQHAVTYWKQNIEKWPYFNPECECVVVIVLNTRLRIKGHQFISLGSLNSAELHAREIFRGAIVGCAFGIIVMHNHPSGDPAPSDSDIRSTRQIVKAGELLRITLFDHVIVGHDKHYSLKEHGYI
jgi:DNA repair protein RadC